MGRCYMPGIHFQCFWFDGFKKCFGGTYCCKFDSRTYKFDKRYIPDASNTYNCADLDNLRSMHCKTV